MIVVPISICGGPATGGRLWTEEGVPYRASRRDVASITPQWWGQLVHGAVPVRLATCAERATMRRTEGSRRDPHVIWRGRPVPPAPRRECAGG